jgi:hypothetical protein
LRLSGITELPSVQSYRLGNKVVHSRDSVFCGVHDEFLKRLDAKEYKPSEFGRFIEEVYLSEAEAQNFR